MKRFLISLILILLFVGGSVVYDQLFMCRFAKEMDEKIGRIVAAENQEACRDAVVELNSYYGKRHPIADHLIFSNRLEDIETLIYKLNAYVEEDDKKEILATAQELRARINMLHSIEFYRGNSPEDFRIK